VNLYIAPYNLGSISAKALAQMLGAKCTEGNKGYSYPSSFINWGNSNLFVRGRGVRRIFNKPEAVGVVANKLLTFKAFNKYNVPTVEWTTQESEAKHWLDLDGIVYGRQYINSSQGKGIKVITQDESWVSCPLYTRALVGRVHEYRVHVAKNKVIDFTRKRRREGGEADSYIRNAENGWVFCRQEEQLPAIVKAACIMAVASVGLDFGACDVIHKHREDKVALLEINSAPGIEGSTLEAYIKYFKSEGLC